MTTENDAGRVPAHGVHHAEHHAVHHAGRQRAALGGLLLAEAMNLLDASITTVAAPVISADLGGSPSSVQWVAAAYTLPFAVALIPGGRLGDILGRRRVFVAAMLGFLVFSLTCAAAPGMSVLLAARALQGVCAGLVIPQTIGLIKAAFRGPALGKALGLMGPVMGLTGVAGPVLGGVLTHADLAGLSWRGVFLVNVPLGALVLAGACCLTEDRAARRPGLDLVGVLLSAAVAAAITVPTIGESMSPRLRTLSALPAFFGAVVLIAHVRRLGKKGRDPIVEPSLFRGRGFPSALATSTVYFAVSTGLVFAVVLYVQNGLHGSVLAASLTVLPFSGGLALSSLIAGQKLLPRLGSRLMLPGIGILALGCLGGAVASRVAAAAPVTTSPWIPASLAVAGLGGGLLTVPFFTTALSRVRPHETGSAAGLLNSVQQLGGTLGVALLGTVYLNRTGSPGHALTLVFTTCLALVLLLALTATGMLRSQPVEAAR
ncbi:MFS transporter [Streptomyces sp. NPDC048172]|uniref:MFS transporter n=1 Tax=Streptomyces sp. NPDC048172 TaxID=3365505 RepID=UPI00372357E4